MTEWWGDFFTNLNAWHWWILAFTLIAFEMLAASFVLFWPGMAALLTGIVVWLFPDLRDSHQIGIFAVFLGVLIWIGLSYRVRFKKLFHAREEAASGLNQRARRYIGRRATLPENVQNGIGYIFLDDTRWRVRVLKDRDLPKDTKLRIIDADGATLVVDEEVNVKQE